MFCQIFDSTSYAEVNKSLFADFLRGTNNHVRPSITHWWQSSRHCYIAAVSSTRCLVRSEKGNKAARWWCHKTGLARHFLQVYDSIKPLSHYRQNTAADNDAATSWISKVVVHTKKRANKDRAEVL